MSRWVAGALLCLAAIGLQFVFEGKASAHRLNLITSDIEWRPDEGVFDVAHRFHLDDALTLLASLGAGDGVLDLEASARLLNYMEATFGLATRNGPLEFEPFGAHIQGNTLFVYQRVKLDSLPLALEVSSQVMQQLEPEIRHQINWRAGQIVRSHEGHRDSPIGWLVLSDPVEPESTPLNSDQVTRF